VIARIDLEDRSVTVDIDGRTVVYDITEMDELALAYATTIHKAQGSEYPIVVMPLVMSHYVMLQRNLLYTGITRAKKALILVGSTKAVHIAVKNHAVAQRNTWLRERLAQQA
jgi:exodeoxyribonuclease V alpha subunit